jgi:hypothetical protein
MAAFACNSGGTEYWDAKTGGSVNATLDTYTISNNTTLVIRSDTNACANHSVAFGSVDTVAWSGTGGTLRFDPTNVRVIAYTGGSGNSPAFGAAISQGGVSGVFLGAWTNWQSECIVPGAAIGATGFIKIGQKTGGNFAAGALTGITATCSGADVQGWIEVRGADTGTITTTINTARVDSVEAWFELGTTSGAANQIIPCPTTATAAGVWPGVWIETSAGSGVYEKYIGVGSTVAVAATAVTDARVKQIWQTTAGIRIGHDGTNAVGFVPPVGCKVRIPATILTNCTRNAGTGSGPRVLPNATIATRQEFVTTNAGTIDLTACVIQWYMNLGQAFSVRYKSCAINDSMILSEISAPLDVDDCMVAPTQAQVNNYLVVTSCFGGGAIKNSTFARFSLANNATAGQVSYATGVTFENNIFRCLITRGTTTSSVLFTKTVDCIFKDNWIIGGGRFAHTQCIRPSYQTGFRYSDHALTTDTNTTAPTQVISFGAGTADVVFDGATCPISFPVLAKYQPNGALIDINGALNIEIRNIGTKASPLVCNTAGSATIVGVAGSGNSAKVRLKRSYITGLSGGPFSSVNSDSDWIAENFNVTGYGGATVPAGLNTLSKGCRSVGATTGQAAQYGTHWRDVFTAATTGSIWLFMNEATAASAAQCAKTGGIPQFSSTGNLLLTKAGDQVTWEMPYYCKGHTAFAATAVGVTGTNATFVSGSNYTNHTLEYQIDLNNGAGYNGSWLGLNATSLQTHTLSASLGFKLKIRATTLVANAGNILTNIRIYTVSTDVAQDNFYPISVNTVSFTGLPTGFDAVVLTAGTSTILSQSDNVAATTYSYQYEGTPTIDIGFIKAGYVPFYIRNLTLTSTDSSIPVSLTADRNYQP